MSEPAEPELVLQGGLPIALLATAFLRLDYQSPIGRNALVTTGQQPGANVLGQRWTVADVKPQVNCRSDFIDILATGALRAHGPDIEFR